MMITPDIRIVRKEAKERLEYSGKRLLLIVEMLFACLPITLFVSLSTVSNAIVKTYPHMQITMFWFCLAVICFFVIFLWLPLIYGIFYTSYLIATNKETDFFDLFHFFSLKKEYGKALFMAFQFVWKICMIYGASFVIYNVCQANVNDDILSSVFAGLLIACIVIFGVLFLLRDFYNLYLVLRFSDTSIRKLIFQGRNIRKNTFRMPVYYFLCAIPWMALGFATFFLYFFIDFWPTNSIVYFYYCEKIYSQKESAHLQIG